MGYVSAGTTGAVEANRWDRGSLGDHMVYPNANRWDNRLGSLGATPLRWGNDQNGYGSLGDDYSYMDHALVPFPNNPPVYMRLLKSVSQAQDYAMAGFHVCVTRGLAGGCKDAPQPGTSSAVCTQPLQRPDLTRAWDNAAGLYYMALQSAGSLSEMIKSIQAANSTADGAYRAEGVPPPTDPTTGATEPAHGINMAGMGIGGSLSTFLIPSLGIAAYLLFFDNKKGKKSKSRRRRR